MEDLEVPNGSPVQQNPPEPEGNNDAGDIQNPEIEEEHTRTPPLADPTDDLDAHDSAPEAGNDDEEEAEPNNDADSDLDELDEAQFDNFDPESATINVPDQPVAVDDSNVGLLGVHKRKRAEGEDGERKKKKKEGRREKAKKVRAGGDDEDNFEGGPEIEGSRRKKAGTAAKRAPRARSPENEDNLSPEERKCAVKGMMWYKKLTSHQAVDARSNAKWTMRSAATSPPVAREAASISKPQATQSSKTCASGWPAPVNWMLKPATTDRSPLTSSRSCPQ
jgi:transcription factor SPN1